MPILCEQLEVSQPTLHMNMSVAQRALADMLTSSLPIRSEPRVKRMCSFAFMDNENTLTIFASTQSVMLKCASAVRTIKNFIFMCTNKLEYLIYQGFFFLFSFGKGGYTN